MSLKEIIRKSLLIGGVVALTAMPLGAEDTPPIVRQEQLMYTIYGPVNNKPVLSLGYDTSGDNWEDIRFLYYMLEGDLPNTARLRLYMWAVDSNKDHNFEENEWFKYGPKVERLNNGYNEYMKKAMKEVKY